MHTGYWDPLDELVQLRECLEPRAQLKHQHELRTLNVAWRPPVDVYETAAQVVVVADLVGVDPKTVVVRIAQGTLVVDGVVAAEPAKEPRVYHRHERWSGPFRLLVNLPAPVLPDPVSIEVERWGLEILILKTGSDANSTAKLHALGTWPDRWRPE